MKLLFLDIETSTRDHDNIKQIWAVDGQNNFVYNWSDVKEFYSASESFDYIVGHNILNHDLVQLSREKYIDPSFFQKPVIDTLLLSTLIFIKKPYHKLIKDYKIDKINNPVEDSKICKEVFAGCLEEFSKIDWEIQTILYNLLKDSLKFKWFFDYWSKKHDVFLELSDEELLDKIKRHLTGLTTDSFDVQKRIKEAPVEFAYIFRLFQMKLSVDKDFSILPKRIIHNLPKTYEIMNDVLRNKKYVLKQELKRFFGYDEFRTFQSINWSTVSQEEVIKDTLKGKDILTVFATWWGKSLTFQLPALINADKTNCLSIVISPLQSLMKDQVDSLKNRHDIQNVWYLNGLLSPLERKETVEEIEYGGIDLLYISPEMLRSETTKWILSGRIIDRIIIDEAHCFSKRWHDFRVDYMFIADFIKQLKDVNPSVKDVNISCFTATAKHEVIAEIKKYFLENLQIALEEFTSSVDRENLHYEVIEEPNEELKHEKFMSYIKDIAIDSTCIVFVRTTKGAQKLSESINQELWWEISSYYHGKLDASLKRDIQDQFISWEKKIIVATNAFGMGIDKENVRHVIHYEVPSSIENYVQEAGRAWRDWKDSYCIIFYVNKDIDKNFRLIKENEVKSKEIKSVFKVIKSFFERSNDDLISISARELAMRSWLNNDFEYRDEHKETLEIKIKTSLYFLESKWFIKRSFNSTRVFATSKWIKSINEGEEVIGKIREFTKDQKSYAIKILHNILSGTTIRVEEIPDQIGIKMKEVLMVINIMRKYKLIEKENDLSLYMNIDKSHKTTEMHLNYYVKVMNALFDILSRWRAIDVWSEISFDKAKVNTEISKLLWKRTLKNELDSIYTFLKWVKDSPRELSDKKEEVAKYITIRNNICVFYKPLTELRTKVDVMLRSSLELIKYCSNQSSSTAQRSNKDIYLQLSLIDTLEMLSSQDKNIKTLHDLEEILLFLHKLWIIRVEGGLFMFWTKFNIQRWSNFTSQFTNTDYKDLSVYYEKKIEQVHIMAEYVNRLRDNNNPKNFLNDYFTEEYESFIDTYFKGRKWEISRSMAPWQYDKLFWELSPEQRKVIDSEWNSIVIAGPWAWKTKTIVHKVVSLILKEWIKKEEFLLLSFSRSAKFEIKKRLVDFLWGEWYFLDIHTFHSFAYKLLWRDTQWNDTDSIIKDAIQYLKENEIILPYSVILLDEFQDINEDQYELVKMIKERSSKSEEMRLIATWDDDQNIYWFQWGNIKFIRQFERDYVATKYVLTTNYRSNQQIIDISSTFISKCKNRTKEDTLMYSNKDATLFTNPLIKAVNYKYANYTQEIAKYVHEIQSIKWWHSQIGILCYTNEKALEIAYTLKKSWFENCELLLKDMWYRLDQTVEFKDFIDSFRESPEIALEEVEIRYKSILEKYWESKNTEKLRMAIDAFLKLNKRIYFKSIEDFFVWIKESELVRESDGNQIIISTLHSAKWKEFESVILFFDEQRDWEKGYSDAEKRDEVMRLLYVWLTRAKEDLIVLWSSAKTPYFKDLYPLFDDNVEVSNDAQDWSREIEIVTWMKDVRLSDNVLKSGLITQLVAIWETVKVEIEKWSMNFAYQDKRIQRSSKVFLEKVMDFKVKWYEIVHAEVFQRIIYTLKDTWETVLIYLFRLHLKK